MTEYAEFHYRVQPNQAKRIEPTLERLADRYHFEMRDLRKLLGRVGARGHLFNPTMAYFRELVKTAATEHLRLGDLDVK